MIDEVGSDSVVNGGGFLKIVERLRLDVIGSRYCYRGFDSVMDVVAFEEEDFFR